MNNSNLSAEKASQGRDTLGGIPIPLGYSEESLLEEIKEKLAKGPLSSEDRKKYEQINNYKVQILLLEDSNRRRLAQVRAECNSTQRTSGPSQAVQEPRSAQVLNATAPRDPYDAQMMDRLRPF